MTYNKPEVTNVIGAFAAVRSNTTKPPNNVPDSDTSNPNKQTSPGYEADE